MAALKTSSFPLLGWSGFQSGLLLVFLSFCSHLEKMLPFLLNSAQGDSGFASIERLSFLEFDIGLVNS